MNRQANAKSNEKPPRAKNAMVCQEEEASVEETNDETNVLKIKRDAEGKPLAKQPSLDAEGDSRMFTRGAERVKAPKPISGFRQKKKRKAKVNTSKKKSISEALGKRVEQFNLLTSISQAPIGLTIGQLVRGDADGLKSDLRKILSGKVRSSALTINSGTAP